MRRVDVVKVTDACGSEWLEAFHSIPRPVSTRVGRTYPMVSSRVDGVTFESRYQGGGVWEISTPEAT